MTTATLRPCTPERAEELRRIFCRNGIEKALERAPQQTGCLAGVKSDKREDVIAAEMHRLHSWLNKLTALDREEQQLRKQRRPWVDRDSRF